MIIKGFLVCPLMARLHSENELHKSQKFLSGRSNHHNFFQNQVMYRHWLVVLDFNGQLLFPFAFFIFFVVSDAAAAVINCLILLNASCEHRSIFAPLSPSGSVSGGIVRTALILEGVKSVFIGNAFPGVLTHILCSTDCLPQLEVIRGPAITWCASCGNHLIIIIFINTVLRACAQRLDMSSNR